MHVRHLTWLLMILGIVLLNACPAVSQQEPPVSETPTAPQVQTPSADPATQPDAQKAEPDDQSESDDQSAADEALEPGQATLRDLFPESLTVTKFILPWYQWICIFVVVFLGLLVDRLVRQVLSRATATWLRLMKTEIDRELEQGLWKPLGLLAMALTWYGGMLLIGLPSGVLAVLMAAVRFFTVVAAVWAAYRLIDLLSAYFVKKAEKTRTKFDDLLIPLISRTLKVFVACVGVVTMAEAFNLPIAGLLGGLGLGGAALALASKDTLSNVFGSVTVLIDRPFEIGDWVKIGDVEGTVETVGIRSTRVRTFYNSLTSVPNSVLTTATVDNMGQRRYRRIKAMLGLQYDTPPERIEAFCEGVRELIRRHPYTRKDYYHVYFNQFSDSSLDVLLYCFLECPDWCVELRERQRLFLDILKLARQLGVSFAFPTRTLHMYSEEPSADETPAALDDPNRAGRRLASQIAGSPLSPEERPGKVEFPGPCGEDDQESGE